MSQTSEQLQQVARELGLEGASDDVVRAALDVELARLRAELELGRLQLHVESELQTLHRAGMLDADAEDALRGIAYGKPGDRILRRDGRTVFEIGERTGREAFDLVVQIIAAGAPHYFKPGGNCSTLGGS